MAHPRHMHVPGGIYLVSAMAARNRDLFVDDEDRVLLGDRLAQVIRRSAAQIFSYSWHPDELLLILQVAQVPVSEIMRLLLSAHARRVNRRLRRKDALFRHPHRQLLLADDICLLEAVLTVHKGGSAWSSHRAYLGEENISWLTRDAVLKALAGRHFHSGDTYSVFAEGQPRWALMSDERRLPIQAVRPLRPYEAFARWMKAGGIENQPKVPLDLLILKISNWLEIPVTEIESLAKSSLLCLARALIAWHARRHGIASLRELSLRFNRARSTISGNRDVYRKLLPALFEIPLEVVLAGPSVTAADVRHLISEEKRRFRWRATV